MPSLSVDKMLFTCGLAGLCMARVLPSLHVVALLKIGFYLNLARVLFMCGLAGVHLARVLSTCGLVALHLAWAVFKFGYVG